MISKLFAYILSLTLLFPPITCAAASLDTAIASTRPLQVYDVADGEAHYDSICSAVSINGKAGFWLTAAHCVVSAMENGVKTYIDGHETYVTLLDEGQDIAIIRTPDYALKAKKVAKKAPKRGDRIFLLGYPYNMNLQYFQGYISSTDTTIETGRVMVFDMSVCPGNSGGPVFNTNNELVSVMQIGYGRSGCAAISAGLTWEKLAEAVSHYDEE